MRNKIKFQNPVYLVGPTGVGKSAIAMALAPMINGEIIVADSMQVYRGLDIGTDKPTFEDRHKIPHHLLDVVDPEENFDVSRFVLLARQALMDIEKRSKTPLVVGGTGLYIKALIDGLFEGPGKNPELRRRMEEEGVEAGGSEILYERLKKVDPKAAEKIDPKNRRRIIRALEIYEMTGKPISLLQNQWGNFKKNVCIIGLGMERQDLYRKIDQRIDRMIEKGLVKEVEALLEKGLDPHSTVMQAIGYKELVEYFKKGGALQEAIDQIKINTRHLAKRQQTWFKKDPRIHWFLLDSQETRLKTVEKIFHYLWESQERLHQTVGS